MEDSKLLALHAKLKSSAPAGGRGGLGAGFASKKVVDTTLPKNALYSNFVRAGHWKPEEDHVGVDFVGKRQVFDVEEEEAETKATESSTHQSKKRKRGEADEEEEEEREGSSGKKSKKTSSDDKVHKKSKKEVPELIEEEEEENPKFSSKEKKSKKASKEEKEEHVTSPPAPPPKGKAALKVEEVLLDTLHLDASASSKNRVKLKHIRAAVMEAMGGAVDDAAFDRALHKMQKKGRVIATEDGKYLSPAADE
jgi:hypothetical protein